MAGGRAARSYRAILALAAVIAFAPGILAALMLVIAKIGGAP
jgi:hypothetical protein